MRAVRNLRCTTGLKRAAALAIAFLLSCSAFSSPEGGDNPADGGVSDGDGSSVVEGGSLLDSAGPSNDATDSNVFEGGDASKTLPPFVCATPNLAINDHFDTSFTANDWQTYTTPSSNYLGIATAFLDETPGNGDGTFALASAKLSNKGVMQANPAALARDIASPSIGAVRLEYVFAHAKVDPYAEIGCGLGLLNQAGNVEVRSLLRMPLNAQGIITGVTTFYPDTPSSPLGSISFPTKDKTWTSIAIDYSSTMAGALTAYDVTIWVNGNAMTLNKAVVAPFTPKGVRVICGVFYMNTSVNNAVAEVAVDNVRLTICP